jgi:hypothetical protein
MLFFDGDDDGDDDDHFVLESTGSWVFFIMLSH